ncbi:MAG TPA: hypothetical protein VLE46_12025 [Nitrospira sp.]|nr:hypothetical protein [Nitrospira sp.]
MTTIVKSVSVIVLIVVRLYTSPTTMRSAYEKWMSYLNVQFVLEVVETTVRSRLLVQELM